MEKHRENRNRGSFTISNENESGSIATAILTGKLDGRDYNRAIRAINYFLPAEGFNRINNHEAQQQLRALYESSASFGVLIRDHLNAPLALASLKRLVREPRYRPEAVKEYQDKAVEFALSQLRSGVEFFVSQIQKYSASDVYKIMTTKKVDVEAVKKLTELISTLSSFEALLLLAEASPSGEDEFITQLFLEQSKVISLWLRSLHARPLMLPVVDYLTKYASGDLRVKVLKELSSKIVFQPVDQVEKRVIAEMFESYIESDSAVALSSLEDSLQSYGLSRDRLRVLLGAWQAGSSGKSTYDVIQKNIQRIGLLEGEHPGIVKYLSNSEYNLNNLARYPFYSLERQFRDMQRGKLGTQHYGTIIFPHADSSGMAYEFESTLERLDSVLSKWDHTLNIGEAMDLGQVNHMLRTQTALYGKKGKLLILIMHGNKKGMGLNGEEYALKSADFKSGDVKNLQEVAELKQNLEENPTVLLVVCSSGVRKGVAEPLARMLNARVVAMNKSVPVANILPKRLSNNSIELFIETENTKDDIEVFDFRKRISD